MQGAEKNEEEEINSGFHHCHPDHLKMIYLVTRRQMSPFLGVPTPEISFPTNLTQYRGGRDARLPPTQS